MGIEHSGSRCEVWTRPEGIRASIALAPWPSRLECFTPGRLHLYEPRSLKQPDHHHHDAGRSVFKRYIHLSSFICIYIIIISSIIVHRGQVSTSYRSTVSSAWPPLGNAESSHWPRTNTLAQRFQDVDGGAGRACRGATMSDNNPTNYEVVTDIFQLADCQAACLQAFQVTE